MKTQFVAMVETSKTITFEISEEEMAMIMAKREKDAHDAKRQAYIDELNNLLARAQRDGFTIATNGRKTGSVRGAKSWGDTAGNWIELA